MDPGTHFLSRFRGQEASESRGPTVGHHEPGTLPGASAELPREAPEAGRETMTHLPRASVVPESPIAMASLRVGLLAPRALVWGGAVRGPQEA